jgi:hypothetical protein
VPFKVTDEMRRMAEAEKGFSAEVRQAQWREFCERMRWNLYRPLRRGLGFRTFAPRQSADVSSDDKFRPSGPNYLYLLAQETRNGDYQSYERFLHYLMLEVTGDTVATVEERFRITFDPQGNNRREWWNEPAHEAWEWLRQQIGQTARPEGSVELNPDLIVPKDAHADKRRFIDPDLHDFMLWEDLHRALPQRQAEVMWLYAMFHDPEKPRETTPAFAEYLQITPATVRWHKAEALKSPQLKKMLGRA